MNCLPNRSEKCFYNVENDMEFFAFCFLLKRPSKNAKPFPSSIDHFLLIIISFLDYHNIFFLPESAFDFSRFTRGLNESWFGLCSSRKQPGFFLFFFAFIFFSSYFDINLRVKMPS